MPPFPVTMPSTKERIAMFFVRLAFIGWFVVCAVYTVVGPFVGWH